MEAIVEATTITIEGGVAKFQTNLAGRVIGGEGRIGLTTIATAMTSSSSTSSVTGKSAITRTSSS